MIDTPAGCCCALVARGVLLDLEDRLDFDRRTGRELCKAESAAGVEAVAFPAEDFVQQVGGSVDHALLLVQVGRGVHAAEDFDDAQAVERAVSVPD